MKFVDYFCGIGGSSYGAYSLGLDPIALIDNDSLCKSALPNEFKNKFLKKDLSIIDDSLLEISSKADIHLYSPPCQSFSKLKYRNKEVNPNGVDYSFIDTISKTVENCHPPTVIIENVPAFLKTEKVSKLVNKLKSLSYFVEAQVIDGAELGVPQRRRRAIVIANKRSFTIKKSINRSTVRLAFDGLPEINKGDQLHRSFRKHSALVLERIKNIPHDGGSRRSLPEHLQLKCHQRSNGYKDVYGRMAWDKVAPTITSGCTNPSKGRFLHPDENRAITLREAARLQTLPDTVCLSGVHSNELRSRLIGNAFPPKFIAALLENVI